MAAEGKEVGGALRGGGAKDRDAVLGRVCKIISSSNWRVKYFGQNKINKDQEEEKSEGICLLDSSSCFSSILHISPLPLNLCSCFFPPFPFPPSFLPEHLVSFSHSHVPYLPWPSLLWARRENLKAFALGIKGVSALISRFPPDILFSWVANI